MNPSVYLKAIVAGVATGLGILFLALNDGIVTPQEWVEVAQGVLVAAAAVYQIPNLPTLPTFPVTPKVSPAPPVVETPAPVDPTPVVSDPAA